MRFVRGLPVVLCCAFGVGCFSANLSAPDSFVCQALRNSVEAPVRDHDELKVIKYLKKQAEKYWEQFLSNSGQCHTEAYHKGFVDGFVDYVQAGGTGEPPYLPPFRYRLTNFRSPEGVTLTEDWYAGFRQGSSVAKASGLRELSYIPLPGNAILKDLNETDATEIARPPSNQKPPAEGSPWDPPVKLPSPRANPPTAPEPRLIPNQLGLQNLPIMEPASGSFPNTLGTPNLPMIPTPISFQPPVLVVQQASFQDRVSIPLAVLPTSFQPPVQPAQAAVPPAPARPNVEADLWRSVAPRSPSPGSGSN